jgi:hypothetical protein
MYVDFLTLAVPAMVLAAIVFQVIATLRVKWDSGSSREQKNMQLRLIWLLPLIGAAVVLAVLAAPPARGDGAHRKGPRKDV